MTKPDKAQTASSFLAGVLALLPEDQRVAAQATFDAVAQVDAARDHIADRTLAQDEFSRSMDAGRADLAAKETTLAEATASMNAEREAAWKWHRDHKTAFEDPAVKAAVTALEAGTPLTPGSLTSSTEAAVLPDLSHLVTQDAQKETLQQLATDAMGVMGQMTAIGLKHKRDFDEDLTAEQISELTTHAQVNQLGLSGVHQLVNQERYTEQATVARAAEIKTATDAAVAEAKVEFAKSTGPGYPLAGQSPEASVVDAFDITPEQQAVLDAKSDPAAMAAAYQQKVAEAPPDAFV